MSNLLYHPGLVCYVCNQGFSQKGNLNRHIRTIHHQIKSFQCNRCKRTFSQKTCLKIHLKSAEKRGSCYPGWWIQNFTLKLYLTWLYQSTNYTELRSSVTWIMSFNSFWYTSILTVACTDSCITSSIVNWFGVKFYLKFS